jgi:TonB family protein
MPIRTSLRVLLIFLLAIDSNGADLRQAPDLIEQASRKNNIFELPSFVMKAGVRVSNFGKPINGTYTLLWNGPEQWREEVSLPGYSEVQVGVKGILYVKRTTSHMPYQILKLRAAMGFSSSGVPTGFFNLGPHGNEKIKKIRDQKIAGEKATCIEIETEMNYSREVCVDQATGTVRRDKTITDSDLIPVGPKLFPRVMAIRKDTPLAEVHITELKTGDPLPPSLFEPPVGAISRPGCMNPLPARKISNVNPQYPDQDKIARSQGTVGLYALINTAGTPQDIEVVLGATAGLNAASVDAVRQWRYEPATCNGTPVSIETIMEVSYTISSLRP